MNLQPGDMVRIRHEALLPNYLLGRSAWIRFVKSDGVCDGFDLAISVCLGNTRKARIRKVNVWKEEVECICCM